MPMPCKNRDGKRPCGTCNELKELTEFHLRPDGYHRSECKPCWKIRCNAHKIAHEDWMASLKDAPCMDCGIKYPSYIMHWDHLPGFDKVASLGVMRAKRMKRHIILEEIAKCELVCANCHGERTHQRHQN